MNKVLMKGNEAIAEAAIRAGCKFYAGYPITPQNQIPEYLSKHMPEKGGIFVQAESEISAINMVFGASLAGARVMTSSSSPGISLKQEGISWLAADELPCVIIDMVRGGPGLGHIFGCQEDYYQAVKGGGHGGYKVLVLAPSGVQEAYDLTMEAFYLADFHRTPVMILGDGILGQMMEPIELKEPKEGKLPPKTWALTGSKGRKPQRICSLFMAPGMLEKRNLRLHEKWRKMEKEIQRWEEFLTEDAEIVLVSYGVVARIAKDAVLEARKKGIKAGLVRPITLWPFPNKIFAKLVCNVKKFLVVEMSMGQMVDDVRLAINGASEVHFHGRTGTAIPSPEEIVKEIRKIIPEKSEISKQNMIGSCK